MEKERNPSRLYLRKKPRIYWGEPGKEGVAPVIYVRKKPRLSIKGDGRLHLRPQSENRLHIRKPRIYWGRPCKEVSTSIIYVRKKAA